MSKRGGSGTGSEEVADFKTAIDQHRSLLVQRWNQMMALSGDQSFWTMFGLMTQELAFLMTDIEYNDLKKAVPIAKKDEKNAKVAKLSKIFHKRVLTAKWIRQKGQMREFHDPSLSIRLLIGNNYFLADKSNIAELFEWVQEVIPLLLNELTLEEIEGDSRAFTAGSRMNEGQPRGMSPELRAKAEEQGINLKKTFPSTVMATPSSKKKGGDNGHKKKNIITGFAKWKEDYSKYVRLIRSDPIQLQLERGTDDYEKALEAMLILVSEIFALLGRAQIKILKPFIPTMETGEV